MEIVDYFFGNIWHFLGLVVVLTIIFSGGLIRVFKFDSTEKDNRPYENENENWYGFEPQNWFCH